MSASLLLLVSSLGAQDARPDSSDLLDRARNAQREFEAGHRTRLPRVMDRTGGRCDEYLGRLCLSEGTVGWHPAEEDSLVVVVRKAPLFVLAEIGALIPGDRWVLSQRIRYLGDPGRWEEA